MNSKMRKRILVGVVLLVVGYFGLYVGIWKWIICHETCHPGESIQVSKRLGKPAEKGMYAQENRSGVLEQMGGPGRYFFNTWWKYDINFVKDIIVPPAHFYLVKNNIGAVPPKGKFLSEPNEQGLQADFLFTTGTWRPNLYGQIPVTLDGKGEIIEAVDKNGKVVYPPIPTPRIDAGYIGVQQVQQGDKTGVLQTVVQPGYYNINPKKIAILPFEVGYVAWETTTETVTETITNPDGSKSTITRPKEGTGVSFPLADGKLMYLDLTVVYGIWPVDAPFAVENYGKDWDAVELKVIEPQVLSICKNAGSNLTTAQFIEGATREAFQEEITIELQKIGKQKRIHFLVALVRGFHPSEDIKTTIQAKRLAVEERQTLNAERERDTVAAELEKANREVATAVTDYDAETTALVQGEREMGEKQAAEIIAETNRQVAELKKQTAEINAEITRILGKADADVIEVTKKAEASRFELLVKAYGGAGAYKLATCADLLPDDMELRYLYSGQGTYWTNPKTAGLDFEELAALQILKESQEKSNETSLPAVLTTTEPTTSEVHKVATQENK